MRNRVQKCRTRKLCRNRRPFQKLTFAAAAKIADYDLRAIVANTTVAQVLRKAKASLGLSSNF